MPKKQYCSLYGLMPGVDSHLRKNLKDHTVKTTHELLTIDNVDKKTEILGVRCASPVTKEIMDSLPKLKLIVTMTTGYDHIDLEEAKKRGVPVCNVPAYGENTVAQHAMALLLGLSRNIYKSGKRVKEGKFEFDGLRGFDLKDKTIGVIGTGHIGAHFIEMLEGFYTKVIAYDKFPNEKLNKKFNFQYVTLNKLFKESDIISLHLPLFPDTHHMINKENIQKMKKGVYIINTARGGLIESEALLWGLETGLVAGAGLDVLEDEDMILNPEKLLWEERQGEVIRHTLMNNLLIDHPRTIITPHNAFNSRESVIRIIDTTVENIKGFLGGKTVNKVG